MKRLKIKGTFHTAYKPSPHGERWKGGFFPLKETA